MSTSSKLLLPLFLTALLFASCRDKGEAPTTPALTFVASAIVLDTTGGQSTPNFQVTFDFIDGDGNIGTYSEELMGCIGEPDILMKVYRMEMGEPTELANSSTSQCIEDLTPIGQNKLLEGEVRVRSRFPPELTAVGDSLRYTVRMRDRDGNLSNIIEAPIKVIE